MLAISGTEVCLPIVWDMCWGFGPTDEAAGLPCGVVVQVSLMAGLQSGWGGVVVVSGI